MANLITPTVPNHKLILNRRVEEIMTLTKQRTDLLEHRFRGVTKKPHKRKPKIPGFIMDPPFVLQLATNFWGRKIQKTIGRWLKHEINQLELVQTLVHEENIAFRKGYLLEGCMAKNELLLAYVQSISIYTLARQWPFPPSSGSLTSAWSDLGSGRDRCAGACERIKSHHVKSWVKTISSWTKKVFTTSCSGESAINNVIVWSLFNQQTNL